MTTSALAGTAVMIGLLALIGYVVAASRSKRPTVIAGERAASGTAVSPEDRLRGIASNPTIWTIGFVILAGLALLGSLGAVGAGPDFLANIGLPLFAALVALGTLAFIWSGAYAAVKSRGYGNALSVAAASFSLGLIAIVVVAAYLLVQSMS